LNDTPERGNALSNNPPANQQWGGRFAAGPAAIMEDINASIGFDRKMWRQDIRGSLAHAAMLGKIGIISQADVVAIGDGLKGIAAEIESGGSRSRPRSKTST